MPAFPAGRIFGIPLRITPGAFLLFGLVGWLLGSEIYPDALESTDTGTHIAMAAASAVLFFLSIVIHELAHCMVARAFHIPVKNITFFVFGGVSQIMRDAPRPLAEFLIAGSGPFLSLVLGGAIFGTWWVASSSTGTAAGIVLIWIASMNVVLGVFNLLPAYPMDGGRIFRALAWMVTRNQSLATRIAAWSGRSIGWGMMGLGALAIFQVDVFIANDVVGGVWLMLVGYFLTNGARQALFQERLLAELDRHTARQLMIADPPVVQSSSSIGMLARGVLELNPRVCYFVEDDGRLAGIVGAPQMRDVPVADWDKTSAGEAMVPASKLHPTEPDRGLAQVLLEMETDDLTHMPVVAEGRVLGVVGRDSILVVLHKAGLLRA